MTNQGHSPALRVDVAADVFFREPDIQSAMEAQAKLCPLTGITRSGPYEGVTMFPGSKHSILRFFTVGIVSMEDWKAHWGDGKATPVLIGCVDYIFQNGEHHQSGFVYEIDRSSPNNGEASGSFTSINPNGDAVAASDIRFAENPQMIAPTN